jgi:DNA-binding transcriptional LysR family regulator
MAEEAQRRQGLLRATFAYYSIGPKTGIGFRKARCVDSTDLAVFVAVAKEESFRSAAKRLRMPVNSVSRRVAGLEEALQTPLLRRTTRAVSLRAEGEALFSRCAAAFCEIDMAREARTSRA